MSGGVFIALGANIEPRGVTIRAALDCLAHTPGIALLRTSSLHETDPVGGPPGQPRFLNAAAELAVQCTPRQLLDRMLAIETELGRVRGVPNGPRTIDLDLLAFHDLQVAEPGLTIPHPRMWQRAFVLEPLAELTDIAALRRRLDPEESPCIST